MNQNKTEKKYLDFLYECDSDQLDCPPNFNYKLEKINLTQLIEKLSRFVKIWEVKSQFKPENENFLVRLGLDDDYSKRAELNISTFAKIVTIDSFHLFDYKLRDNILKILSECNYVYIPESIMRKKYSGQIYYLRIQENTWKTLYFTYLESFDEFRKF